MTQAIASAAAIDWILALVGLEAAGVALFRVLTGRGPALLPFFATLLAGVFLLLALRSALAGSSATWVVVCLVAGLFAHLADLIVRWDAPTTRRPPPDTGPRMRATLSLRVSNAPLRVSNTPATHARRAQQDRSSDA